MTRKEWRVNSPDIEKSSALAVRLEVSPLLAQLLVNRGIDTVEAAQTYLYPTLADLHDPFLMHGMERAVDRIRAAVKRGEQIWVYGDYHADGAAAVALLLSVFRERDVPMHYYIPNRFREGYGLNQEVVKDLKAKGCELLITLDCGVSTVPEVHVMNKAGMDVVSTGYHEGKEALPFAHADITPVQGYNQNHSDSLTGVGLAFKLAHGLMGGGKPAQLLIDQLDLVVLGTVVDMATLTGENRTLTRLGLAEINRRKRPGIRALCHVAGCGKDKPIHGDTLVFRLGPRINAAGRMDTASNAVELLTAESDRAAFSIAEQLDAHNTERREVTQRILDESINIVEREVNLDKVKGVVLAREGWHKGVVAVVVTRIMQRYHRPVFLLAIDGDVAHGSGRSIEGLNLADSLNTMTDLLVSHGGHKAAAGLTIETKKIQEFGKFFNQYVSEHLSEEDLVPKLDIDFEAQLSFFTLSAIKEMSVLEPYGQDNPAPQLAIRRVILNRPPRQVGMEQQHLKLSVSDGRHTLDAIGWRMAGFANALKNPNESVDLVGTPQINEWEGQRSPQLEIKDIRLHRVGLHMQENALPSRNAGNRSKRTDGGRANQAANNDRHQLKPEPNYSSRHGAPDDRNTLVKWTRRLVRRLFRIDKS